MGRVYELCCSCVEWENNNYHGCKNCSNNLPYITDSKCTNNGEYICNLGFACDGCPYNKDKGR